MFCPVVEAYLTRMRTYITNYVMFAENYTSQLEAYEDLLALQDNLDSRIRQHQRAFLCIEMMVHHVAKILPVGIGQEVPMVFWKRSREGLNEFVSILRNDGDNLVANLTEYSIASSWGGAGQGADQLHHDNQERLTSVYRYAGESAVILRQALRNPNVKLFRVGRRLAQAAEAARMGVPDWFSMANALFEQRKEHAPRAWEIPKL
jgi:hypothetical protein